jgi:hypothetical protein
LQNNGHCFISLPAEPVLCLNFVFCRTNTTSSVCLQNQYYICSLSAEPRLRLQYVICRTVATALFRCLQNQYCVLISYSAEPVPPLQFLCRTKTMSSVRFLHFTFIKAESPS